jgi:hypothetical protein
MHDLLSVSASRFAGWQQARQGRMTLFARDFRTGHEQVTSANLDRVPEEAV